MRTRLALAVAAALAGSVLTGSVPIGSFTALTAAAATSEPDQEQQSWVGWVERHGDHHDYSGSPCPEQSDFCTANIVRYRLVPETPAVAGELAAQEGRRTRLRGRLDRVEDDQHQGVLTVKQVEPLGP